MFFSCAKSFVQRFFTDEVHTDSVRHGSFFSNDLVPSLGARINQEIELRRRIISPYNPRYRAWQMWLVVLVIYSAWISPFQFAFLTYKKDGLFVVDNIVNGFFAIDIVLTFFVAYLDSQSCLLIDDPDWKHDQSRCALDQPDKEFCTYTFFEFCPVSANDFRHNEDVLNRQTALHADSLEELLNIAGEKFGGYTFGKVINAESAEIDDIHVIRDGDHLIFLENHMENT